MTAQAEWSEDDEALAAEYAMGLLAPAEHHAAEHRLGADAAFRAAVAAWQERLAGLAGEVAPVEPPARLKAAVEARVFGAAPSRRVSPLRLLLGFAAGAVIASWVAVIVAIFVWPLPPAPSLHANIAAETGALRFEAVYDGIDEEFTVRRIAGPAPPQGQAHELWLIPPGAAPRSMGVIGDGPHLVGMVEPPAGWTLAVSLEPEGGSPTGAPTGPVVATGVLTKL